MTITYHHWETTVYFTTEFIPGGKGKLRHKVTRSYNGVSIKGENEIPHLMLTS